MSDSSISPALGWFAVSTLLCVMLAGLTINSLLLYLQCKAPNHSCTSCASCRSFPSSPFSSSVSPTFPRVARAPSALIKGNTFTANLNLVGLLTSAISIPTALTLLLLALDARADLATHCAAAAVFALSVSANHWTIFLISVDRFYAIADPLKEAWVTRGSTACLAALWTLSVVAASFPFLENASLLAGATGNASRGSWAGLRFEARDGWEVSNDTMLRLVLEEMRTVGPFSEHPESRLGVRNSGFLVFSAGADMLEGTSNGSLCPEFALSKASQSTSTTGLPVSQSHRPHNVFHSTYPPGLSLNSTFLSESMGGNKGRTLLNSTFLLESESDNIREISLNSTFHLEPGKNTSAPFSFVSTTDTGFADNDNVSGEAIQMYPVILRGFPLLSELLNCLQSRLGTNLKAGNKSGFSSDSLCHESNVSSSSPHGVLAAVILRLQSELRDVITNDTAQSLSDFFPYNAYIASAVSPHSGDSTWFVILTRRHGSDDCHQHHDQHRQSNSNMSSPSSSSSSDNHPLNFKTLPCGKMASSESLLDFISSPSTAPGFCEGLTSRGSVSELSSFYLVHEMVSFLASLLSQLVFARAMYRIVSRRKLLRTGAAIVQATFSLGQCATQGKGRERKRTFAGFSRCHRNGRVSAPEEYPCRKSYYPLQTKEMVKTAVLIVMVFVLTSGPHVIVAVAALMTEKSVPFSAHLVTQLLVYLACCLNPFLYSFLRRQVRVDLKRTLQRAQVVRRMTSLSLKATAHKSSARTVQDRQHVGQACAAKQVTPVVYHVAPPPQQAVAPPTVQFIGGASRKVMPSPAQATALSNNVIYE